MYFKVLLCTVNLDAKLALIAAMPALILSRTEVLTAAALLCACFDTSNFNDESFLLIDLDKLAMSSVAL